MYKFKMSVFVAAILLATVFACPLYAAEYKNAEFGFSVNYPDSCEKQSPTKGTIFYAIASAEMPWFTVGIVEGAAFELILKPAFSVNPDITNFAFNGMKDIETDSGIKAKAAQIKYIWRETYDARV